MQKLEQQVKTETIVKQSIADGTHKLACSIVLKGSGSGSAIEFDMSLVAGTEKQQVPTYKAEGGRQSLEYPVFSLHKAYKNREIESRYALINYNQTSYCLVDCKTGKKAEKPKWLGLLNNTTIHSAILNNQISTQNLDAISKYSGGDMLLPKDPSIDIEALLQTADIQYTHDWANFNGSRKACYATYAPDYQKLTDAIDFISKHGNKELVQIIESDRSIKWN